MTNENQNDKTDENEDEKRLTDAEKKRELEDLFKDFMAVIFEEDRKANGEIEEEDSEDENKE